MNYLVAVLSDRAQAEQAYAALQQQGIATEQVEILGNGYKTADEYGLINPEQSARKSIGRLLAWLMPFGFVAGYSFNLLTGIVITPAIAPIGNHILGGLLGAASGALGAYVVGSLTGLTVGSGDALPYRSRLSAGKYLIVIKGKEALIRQATPILRQFQPENLQGYVEQATPSEENSNHVESAYYESDLPSHQTINAILNRLVYRRNKPKQSNR